MARFPCSAAPGAFPVSAARATAETALSDASGHPARERRKAPGTAVLRHRVAQEGSR